MLENSFGLKIITCIKIMLKFIEVYDFHHIVIERKIRTLIHDEA